MNRMELEQELVQLHIPKDMYSFSEEYPNEGYCLNHAEKWEVYYSERGEKTGMRLFDTEEEGCDFLREILMGVCEKTRKNQRK